MPRGTRSGCEELTEELSSARSVAGHRSVSRAAAEVGGGPAWSLPLLGQSIVHRAYSCSEVRTSHGCDCSSGARGSRSAGRRGSKFEKEALKRPFRAHAPGAQALEGSASTLYDCYVVSDSCLTHQSPPFDAWRRAAIQPTSRRGGPASTRGRGRGRAGVSHLSVHGS
eukprot:SAG31_NODE_176_length_21334_cov_12.211067_19_plen_168_part_00